MSRIFPYTLFVLGNQIYDLLVRKLDMSKDENEIFVNIIFFLFVYGSMFWLMIIEIMTGNHRLRFVFVGYFLLFFGRFILFLLSFGKDWNGYNLLVNNIWIDFTGWSVLLIILTIWAVRSKPGIST